MTPSDEISRGHNATRVLNDAIYVEAYTVIRERLITLLERDIPQEQRNRVNDDIRALARVHVYMEKVAEGGRFAAQQIERDRTLAERMGDRLRSVA